MKYQAPFGSLDPAAPYVDRNTPGAVAGSKAPAAAIEHPQREMVALIEGSGLATTDADLTQVARAVRSQRLNYAVTGGTANALTASLSPALERRAGLPLRLLIAATNTGPATLNGVPIKWPLPDGGDTRAGDLVAGDVVSLIDDGAVYRIQPTIGMLDGRYSRLVPPPATAFYVFGAGGSDTNTGLANTAGAGFATIQGAINTLNARYTSLSRITLNVAAGAFAGFIVPNANIRSWLIIGASPTTTQVSANTSGVNNGRACLVEGADVIAQNLRLSAFFECASVSPQGGSLEVVNCNLNLASTSSYAISAAGGQIGVFGAIGFSGSGLALVNASGGAIRLGFTDGVTTRNVSFDSTAGVTVSDAAVVATDGGRVLAFPGTFFTAGTPTGKRYAARLNGTINTQGGGANFFPGTLAGTNVTGGQYA